MPSLHRNYIKLVDDYSWEELRNFTNTIREGVCAIDENGIVVIWNQSAEAIYNIKSEEIIGRRVTDFFPDALMERVRLSRVAEFNVPHHPHGNKNTHIVISAAPWYVNGEFKGVVSTDRDYAEVSALYAAEFENSQARLAFFKNQMKRSSGVFASFIGQNRLFLQNVDRAAQIAPTYANVIISGESGTGKELFARGIHELSGRTGLFVPINTSAIPAELFESEFFGYAPNAFTGACKKGKPGYFEMAAGGTIFLDEISEMPFTAQAKLLRALQEREIMRVGGSAPVKIDVRVIAASNKNLLDMVRHNTFREDLYYRLNVVEITLPPLRERREDIPLLIEHFANKMAEKNKKHISIIHRDVIALLCEYSWPGNIRELMNVIENLVITCDERVIAKKHIPYHMMTNLSQTYWKDTDSPLDLASATQAMEKEKIRKALEICKYNKSKAARMLGIPRASLYNKIHEYGI